MAPEVLEITKHWEVWAKNKTVVQLMQKSDSQPQKQYKYQREVEASLKEITDGLLSQGGLMEHSTPIMVSSGKIVIIMQQNMTGKWLLQGPL